MSRNCLVVDLDKCIGCHACEVACKNENGIALGEYWNRVLQIGPHGTFPDLEQYWLPVQCQQCEAAPCVQKNRTISAASSTSSAAGRSPCPAQSPAKKAETAKIMAMFASNATHCSTTFLAI